MNINEKSNYEAWQIQVNDFSRLSTVRERMLFLVGFAILAPSSHNSQPWHFVITDSEIVLRPDFSRALPVSDASNRHLYFALGCALENLLVAADYYGLRFRVEYFSEGDDVARISFMDKEEHSLKDPNGHLISFIPKRLMNRTPYEKRPLAPAFLELVRRLSSSTLELRIISDEVQKNAITAALLDFRYRAFDDPSFRAELSSYKRTNITRSFLGMPGFTMGFNTPLSLIAPWMIRHMNVMKLIGKTDRKVLRENTPVFIIAGTYKDEKLDWVRSGQVAERMMLEAGRHGLAVAASALPHNPEAFANIFEPSFYPQLFFRVGYTKHTPGHSPRLAAEDVSTIISS